MVGFLEEFVRDYLATQTWGLGFARQAWFKPHLAGNPRIQRFLPGMLDGPSRGSRDNDHHRELHCPSVHGLG